ncbi:polysaccharide deacetylase family protein [Streptomyces fagopyri]
MLPGPVSASAPPGPRPAMPPHTGRRPADLVREIAAAGHEIGVHGGLHRPLLLRGPRATYDDFARARDAVAAITGQAPSSGRVLLHDSDRTSAPGAWRATPGVLPRILDTCASRGYQAGRLCDHGWRDNTARPPRTREHPGSSDRLQFGRPSTLP